MNQKQKKFLENLKKNYKKVEDLLEENRSMGATDRDLIDRLHHRADYFMGKISAIEVFIKLGEE